MARRNAQQALFWRDSRASFWNDAALILLTGMFFVVLAVILNPDVSLVMAGGVGLVAGLLEAFAVTRPWVRRIAFVVAALVLVCLFTPALRPLEAALDVSQAPQKADVIVTLGGGMRCGSQQLESASLARVVKGLELWRQGYAATLTFSDTSGLWPDCPSLALSAARETALLAPQNAPEIITLPNVHSTRDEAQAVAKVARERHWQRILIVTSPSHSRRAQATFRQLKLEAFVVAASEPRFDTSLRLPFDRLMALQAFVREVAGLVKYSLFGWF